MSSSSMKRFVPSKYNLEIFKTFEQTDKNICVSACPGSGKTTTLLELFKRVPKYKKSIFLAFNKSIVQELETKVPAHVETMTIHSFGCKAIYREFRGKVKVDENKLFKIAKKIERSFKVEKKKKEAYIYNLIRIIDLYRMRLETSRSALIDIIVYYNIDILGDEQNDAEKLLNAYLSYNENWKKEGNEFLIDYADMIYLPAIKNYQLNQYDEVFIDESQDFNCAQQTIIDKIIKPGGRFVAVGDPRQSIYAFMSADVDSYYKFSKKENTVELPLSISYRCAKKIVEEANKIYNVIECSESAQEGNVSTTSNIRLIREQDFVLCRNTKPLVELYFQLISLERTCYIKGSDIGKKIKTLIKHYKSKSKSELLEGLREDLNNVYLSLLEKGIRKPYKNQKYQTLDENIQIIKLFCEKYNTVAEIINAISIIFKDVSSGIMLSTIHKSKGLEANNVFLLKRSLIPSEYAEMPHELEQENNLLFVAITRAKTNFYYLN